MLEDCGNDCRLKKHTAMCDSFKIDSIEKTFLHATLILDNKVG